MHNALLDSFLHHAEDQVRKRIHHVVMFLGPEAEEL
jgi:hypothetical protein